MWSVQSWRMHDKVIRDFCCLPLGVDRGQMKFRASDTGVKAASALWHDTEFLILIRLAMTTTRIPGFNPAQSNTIPFSSLRHIFPQEQYFTCINIHIDITHHT
jgi:hypothetical protein